ncbi:hypothetical protein [Mesorhizobium sp. M0058]|uniref:hypothetical protein n=1 Tax=Mesorhizobium sp. M0058 TaxID=2956865 RepID=UPI00333680EE
MKTLTKLARLAMFSILAVTIAVGVIWYAYFRPIIIQGTLKSEAASLSFVSSMLESGARPEDWENRAYLPTTSINNLAASLTGLEFVVSQGKRDEAGRYDGAFVISLNSVSFETRAAQLRPRLSVTARYVPDRVDHWWSNAFVALTIDAQLMPAAQTDPATGRTDVKLLVIPTSIRPSLSWNPFEIFSAGEVASEIVAAGVLLKYGEELALAVPAIKSPIKIEARVDSKSHSDFDKGGGYDLQVKLDGPTFERLIVADVPLVTSQGIWMLGQSERPLPKPVALPSDPSELQKTVDKLRLSVAEKLKPFDRIDGIAEVRVSNQQILDLASEIQRPWKNGQNKIIISSANASGTIASAFLLKDDLLGDVGLTVTPRIQDFVHGEVSVQPPQLGWVPGTGLSSTVAASAKVTASGHIHLSTGAVGGGIGKDIDLIGETSIALPVSLKPEKRVTPSGTAVVLQPQLSCVRIEIDVNPMTREDFIKEAWIALKPFGVRVKRNVGGGQQAPSILLDSLPSTYILGEKPDAGKPKKDSYFQYKELQVSWTIDDVQVQSNGLSMRARPTVEPELAEASEIDKQRDALKEAVLNSAPNVPCAPEDAYALLLVDNQVEIGSNNEVVVFIKKIFKEGGHVAEESKKEIEKLAKTPFQSIVDAPDNVIREGGKGLENVAKGIEDAGKAAGEAAKAVVCGEKCVLGVCGRVC